MQETKNGMDIENVLTIKTLKNTSLTYSLADKLIKSLTKYNRTNIITKYTQE